MKKTYSRPVAEVIKIQTQQIICMSKLENPVTDPLAPSFDDADLEGYFGQVKSDNASTRA